MKKLTSILLTLVLLMSFIPSAFASGYTYSISIEDLSATPDCTEVDITVPVSNLSFESTSDNLFVAAYSDQNELLDISSVPVTLDPREVSSYSLSISADAPVDKVKVFVWDSWTNLTPLAEAVECTDIAPIQYAIALRVTPNNAIKLLHSDGTSENYDADSSVDVSGIKDTLSTSGADVSARVVAYKVKASTGEISSLDFVDCASFDAQYKARTGKIGVYPITDSTIIIDATQVLTASDAKSASNYEIMSQRDLVDGYSYKGYAFREGFNATLVILTDIVDPDAKPEFTVDTRFAVVQAEAVEHYTDDDEECEMVLSLYDGREQELLFLPDVYDSSNLSVGDAFFFETDKRGFINKVHKVYSALDTSVTEFAEGVIETGVADGWSYGLISGVESIQLTTAAIVDVKADYITFADLAEVADNGIIDTNADLEDGVDNGIVTYTYASDLAVYVYDINNEDVADEEDKFKARNSYSAIKASNIGRYEATDDDETEGLFTGVEMARVNEAFAMIVDGDIVAIYVIQK